MWLCVSSCQAAELEGKGQNLVLGFQEGRVCSRVVKVWGPGRLVWPVCFCLAYIQSARFTQKKELVWKRAVHTVLRPMLKAWYQVKGCCEHVSDSCLVLRWLSLQDSFIASLGKTLAFHSNGLRVFRLTWLHTENTCKPPVRTEQPSSSLVVPWVIRYKHCLHGIYCTVFRVTGNAGLSIEDVFGIAGQRARWVDLANQGQQNLEWGSAWGCVHAWSG